MPSDADARPERRLLQSTRRLRSYSVGCGRIGAIHNVLPVAFVGLLLTPLLAKCREAEPIFSCNRNSDSAHPEKAAGPILCPAGAFMIGEVFRGRVCSAAQTLRQLCA